MWWLSFRDGGAVIISASSLAHARLLAARNGLGRASNFVEGYFIDMERMSRIESEFVGRMLSPIEAMQVEEMLDRRPRDYTTDRRPEPAPKSPRHRN